MAKQNKLLLYSLGIVGGLAAAALCSSLFYNSWKSNVIITLPLTDCDVLASACVAELPTGEKIYLSLNPTVLPTMIPLSIEVRTEELNPLSASVNFSGIEMYMGENHPMLLRQEQSHFEGKTILPVCSKSFMRWRATVFVETDRGRIAAPFGFTVHKQDTPVTFDEA